MFTVLFIIVENTSKFTGYPQSQSICMMMNKDDNWELMQKYPHKKNYAFENSAGYCVHIHLPALSMTAVKIKFNINNLLIVIQSERDT